MAPIGCWHGRATRRNDVTLERLSPWWHALTAPWTALGGSAVWDLGRVAGDETLTVWERLREYAATQSGPFTSQEVLSWFRRHAPSQANDPTVRTYVRGACWNVENRAQFAKREPFLTRLDRGLFRRATAEEVQVWRAKLPDQPDAPAEPARTTLPTCVASGFEWHTVENTQRLLVEWLRRQAWTIVRTANTASREHGVDVVAEREGTRLGVEVKGYPSRFYVTGLGKDSKNKPRQRTRLRSGSRTP